jgi:hypothetical protein
MRFRVGQYVWVPVPAVPEEEGYVPKEFKVKSVGTWSLHLEDGEDVFSAFAYDSRSVCVDRCDELFKLKANQPKTKK